MKLHIPFLSLALTCTLGLLATADHLAYLKTQPMIEASIVTLNVENVRSQVASIDLPANVKAEILKNLKITAKTVRTQLRLQMLENSQKSRTWAGIKAAAQIYIVGSILKSWRGDFNSIKDMCCWTLKDAKYIATNPQRMLFPHVIHAVNDIEMSDSAIFCFCALTSYYALQNATSAYYGTSLIRQKLEKIEQILEIIESAQQN